MKVKFLDYNCYNGSKNMAFDSKMLESAIRENQDYASIRFYGWSPKCISLGKSQVEDDINSFGIDIVKRVTGGRALLHDNELTYAVVMPQNENEGILASYKFISDGLILGFKELGIELDYAGTKKGSAKYCMNISCGADVSFMGKKLIGSAQFRSHGYILQHGSILFDLDYDLIEKIFGQKPDKNSIVTMKEINDKITKEELVGALKNGFKENFKHRNYLPSNL